MLVFTLFSCCSCVKEKDDRLEKRRQQRVAKAKAAGGSSKREEATAQTAPDTPTPPPGTAAAAPVSAPSGMGQQAGAGAGPGAEGDVSAITVTGKCNTCSAVFYAAAEQKAHYRWAIELCHCHISIYMLLCFGFVQDRLA
jgi:hypothetical protein